MLLFCALCCVVLCALLRDSCIVCSVVVRVLCVFWYACCVLGFVLCAVRVPLCVSCFVFRVLWFVVLMFFGVVVA